MPLEGGFGCLELCLYGVSIMSISDLQWSSLTAGGDLPSMCVNYCDPRPHCCLLLAPWSCPRTSYLPGSPLVWELCLVSNNTLVQPGSLLVYWGRGGCFRQYFVTFGENLLPFKGKCQLFFVEFYLLRVLLRWEGEWGRALRAATVFVTKSNSFQPAFL